MIRTILSATLLTFSAHLAHADQSSFATPQDGTEALMAALAAKDMQGLTDLFGKDSADLLSSGDAAEDKLNRLALLALYRQGYRLIPMEDGAVELALGREGWPFPIRMVRTENAWQFDIETGREAVLARHIGNNELDVIDLMAAYVDVQAAYRQVDHDGDGVMEFASAIISSEGTRDGLFWDGPESPLGPRLAQASAYGYSEDGEDQAPQPHAGYYFHILQSQGPAAPGGAMNYIINDNMVGGHAMIAVPAEYGVSGVHSFMVSENGLIYEADLGPDTLDLAHDITAFDPGEGWHILN